MDKLLIEVIYGCLSCGRKYKDVFSVARDIHVGSLVDDGNCCTYHQQIVTQITSIEKPTREQLQYVFDYSKFLDFPWPIQLEEWI